MKLAISFPVVLFMLLMACQQEPREPNLILDLLQDRGPIVKKMLASADDYEIQILYTQVNRDSNNKPSFQTYSFRVDDSTYFYPASTVKFPAAVLALEKLRSLNIEGLDAHTVMLTDSAYEGQSIAWEDSSSESGLPSVAQYVKKILLVSDNDAYNRLYEFIGQGPLNQSLWERGHSQTRLLHRLSIAMTAEQNRHTNPIRFVDGDQILYEQPLVYNAEAIATPNEIKRGKGYMRGGELQKEPMDFTSKNFFPLKNQQDILMSAIFPNDVNGQNFNLADEDYQLLYKYMSQLPRESRWPSYDSTYYDSYVKFFMFGDKKEKMPDHIRIFNKVGFAYGTLTDNAYIVDFENGIEFFLAATVFVNENQIFNDNVYEYDELGIPFLAEVGRAIYEYERERPKAHLPDLSRFRLRYDQ